MEKNINKCFYKICEATTIFKSKSFKNYKISYSHTSFNCVQKLNTGLYELKILWYTYQKNK